MKLLHLNRRTHLYLGLVLLPWFLMYGISSIPFSHAQYFNERDRASGLPLWTQRFERPYEIAIPEEGSLREVAAKVAADVGISGAYGAYRPNPNQVTVYIHTFWKASQVKYFVKEKKIVVEDRRFRWANFLTGMHAKGGWQNGGLHNVWSVVIDLVCLSMLLWVLTGVVMWWKLPRLRAWGWLALCSGAASFALFLWLL